MKEKISKIRYILFVFFVIGILGLCFYFLFSADSSGTPMPPPAKDDLAEWDIVQKDPETTSSSNQDYSGLAVFFFFMTGIILLLFAAIAGPLVSFTTFTVSWAIRGNPETQESLVTRQQISNGNSLHIHDDHQTPHDMQYIQDEPETEVENAGTKRFVPIVMTLLSLIPILYYSIMYSYNADPSSPDSQDGSIGGILAFALTAVAGAGVRTARYYKQNKIIEIAAFTALATHTLVILSSILLGPGGSVAGTYFQIAIFTLPAGVIAYIIFASPSWLNKPIKQDASYDCNSPAERPSEPPQA